MKSVIFSDHEVRAALDGRKTQFRRAVKGGPNIMHYGQLLGEWALSDYIGIDNGVLSFKLQTDVDDSSDFEFKCPYGKPGDCIWVRETWRPKGHNFPTGPHYEYRATAEDDGVPEDMPWKPSTHMPRAACRILLEITGIRVERLKEISEQDAISEGIETLPGPALGQEVHPIYDAKSRWVNDRYTLSKTYSFESLWKSINGPDAWYQNPWVFVIDFKRIEQ